MNRGPERASLHLLPTIWFRNTWSWGRGGEGYWPKPQITHLDDGILVAEHQALGRFRLAVAPEPGGKLPEFLFTENETNTERLFGKPNAQPYVKDGFHHYVIDHRSEAVNHEGTGTKAAAYYLVEVESGKEISLRLRLTSESEGLKRPFGPAFEQTFQRRIAEADQFYKNRFADGFSEEEENIVRQACAGLLWTKQFYHYVITDWLEGDPNHHAPPESRKQGRNSDWRHLYNRDVVSMPDKWEFPWYAAWDLAFHMVALAEIDPAFTKQQLILFLREWYMHPNGQIPAYEFAFADVNPPVHAWGCWQVYKITTSPGTGDRLFLARAFQKLLLNFTWWVNRKDILGKHLFAGGFLGLDNIGLFDRSKPLAGGGFLEQADGTAWMAFFCCEMLAMALELARGDPSYEDVPLNFLSISSLSRTQSTRSMEPGFGMIKTGFTMTTYMSTVTMCRCGRVPWSASFRFSPWKYWRKMSLKSFRVLPGECSGFSIIAKTWHNISPAWNEAESFVYLQSRRASASNGSCVISLMKRSFSLRLEYGRFRAYTRMFPMPVLSVAKSIGSSMFPANPTLNFSAETPTGGGRSGCL